MAPKISGWLVIDISSHLDQYGFVTHEGERVAWQTMSGAGEDANVRLRIGGLRHLTGLLIPHLIEGGILTAREIEVEGSDPQGVSAILTALRGLRALDAVPVA